MDAVRAWTEIDLDSLSRNLSAIRARASAGARVMLVVKQDAYGHGAVAVSHHATRAGIGALGVGTSGEALELRHAGVRLPIVILGTVVDEELDSCLRHEIHIGVHSSDRCRSLQERARRSGLRARVHLNVDTGMGRLGVPPALADGLMHEIASASHLVLAGVMTHIAAPEGHQDPFTDRQLSEFDGVVSRARRAGIRPGWVHAMNSATLFTAGREDSALQRGHDTVRVGIAAYGALPPGLTGQQDLCPVMAVRSRVVFMKDVQAGTPVGYGSTWRAPRSTRIATIPVGYGHGLPWGLEQGVVLVGGRRAPIVGRLSMDYTTIDVGHLSGVEVGQVVTLVGRDGEDELTLQDLAQRASSIPYEISCALGRLDRIYMGGEQVDLPGQTPLRAREVRSVPVPPTGAGQAPTLG